MIKYQFWDDILLGSSPSQWTWVWVSSESWWWTERPGALQSMGSQWVGQGWVAELSPSSAKKHYSSWVSVKLYKTLPSSVLLFFFMYREATWSTRGFSLLLWLVCTSLFDVFCCLDPLDRRIFMIYFFIFHSGMGSLSLNLSQVADQKAWWKQFP